MKSKIIAGLVAALISTSANARLIGYVNKGYPICMKRDQLVNLVIAIDEKDQATFDKYINANVCVIVNNEYPIEMELPYPDGISMINQNYDNSWTLSKGVTIRQ